MQDYPHNDNTAKSSTKVNPCFYFLPQPFAVSIISNIKNISQHYLTGIVVIVIPVSDLIFAVSVTSLIVPKPT